MRLATPLQISAPISPGSSGGPVFNLRGEVVGISSFQLVDGQNLNFAIPVEEFVKIQNERDAVPLAQFYLESHPATARSGGSSDLAKKERGSKIWAADSPATEDFVGTVHNTSVNLTANFGIFIKESNGIISGCMAVRSPLFGSGPLHGSMDQDALRFDVISAAFTIRFTGIRTGRGLSGTYTVLKPDGTSEQGEFH